MALSVAVIPLTWCFARRLGLNGRVALLSAAVVAVSPTMVLWAPVLGSENLQIVLLLVGCALACRMDTSRRAVAVGAIFGLAVLVRPETLFYLAALPLLSWLAVQRWKRVASLSAIAVLACIAVIAPWYVRNQVVVGSGVGLSTTGGLNFYLAHRSTGYGFVESSQTPLKSSSEPALSRSGYSLGLDNIAADPAGVLVSTLHGTYGLYDWPRYAALFGTRRSAAGKGPYAASVSSEAVSAARFAVGAGWIAMLILIPIGVATMTRAPSTRRALWPTVGLLTANWVCFAVVFWGMPRYRFPIEPVLAIFAGAGVHFLLAGDRTPSA